MRVIRSGITRTVILVGRWAVKLPSARSHGAGARGALWSVCRGILANQCEAEWWRNAPPDRREVLCPVLRSWLGGVVNVYPRCEPFVVAKEQELAMSERRWSPVSVSPSPGDDKPGNFGLLAGRVVRLDYDMNWNGCPHDRSGVSNAKRS